MTEEKQDEGVIVVTIKRKENGDLDYWGDLSQREIIAVCANLLTVIAKTFSTTKSLKHD